MVLRCQEGDSEAFGDLVRNWQKRLWQYAYRLTNSSATAYDISQETWCAVIKGLRKLSDASLFPCWIYRIHHRKCVDWIRKEERRSRGTKELQENIWATSSQESTSEMTLLESVVRKLAPDRKALIALRYNEGFPIGQIAEILKIPEGTVKSRLHRIINELRILVEHESHE